jgi:hypothetical protein
VGVNLKGLDYPTCSMESRSESGRSSMRTGR